MAVAKDYYELLGVERGATADEIRRAYRRLARKYHPDVNKSTDAATRFSEIQEAYDVLSDAGKRKAYDRFGAAGVGVGSGAAGFGGARWDLGDFAAGGDPSGFSSIFEEMFAGRAGSPHGGPGPRAAGARRPRPRRGGDVQHRLTVSFLTAARGGTERIRLGGRAGPGAGGGQSIEVKIPAGIDSGAKLRLKGKGHPGPDGGAAGDIILTIAVGKHPYFRREGLDLLVDVPLTLAEAALGTTVTVPLLTGSVEIKVPPGADSGQRLRVKGKGIARPQGAAGDFHAVIQIAAPKTLSDRARQLLSDLAPELKNPRESAPWASDARGSAG